MSELALPVMSEEAPLAPEVLRRLDAWWRAANYLSVGQIYLLDNPLLREPLQPAHVKPRLLGHWGTTPGLNFIYAHLNRAIATHDLDMIYIAGPGYGGSALAASTWLEGSYSEHYPNVSRDAEGMQELFRLFSFPGGIGSHAAPEIPASIHEGGELGYALAHVFGVAFDYPDLIVACVIGDGEAETGPLAAAWHSNKFLNPARDGAVLPILHLNGYKIANPTVLAVADTLRRELPQLKLRVVNVVDLMTLQSHEEHPHGLSDRDFDTLFTTGKPVIFAYHGYPWLIHRLTYWRTNHKNLHVRGYKEEGTTTPFDMAVLNDLDRLHLVMDVIDRVPGPAIGRRRCASACATGAPNIATISARMARTCRRSATGKGVATRRVRTCPAVQRLEASPGRAGCNARAAAPVAAWTAGR